MIPIAAEDEELRHYATEFAGKESSIRWASNYFEDYYRESVLRAW